MLLIKRLIPALTLTVTTILVALPWGMSAESRFLLPLFPLIVIHYWTVHRPDVTAEWWAFAAGLSLDILTHGPMGYWALIYLLAYAAAKVSSVLAEDSVITKWIVASITLFILTAVGWAVSSLYYFELADWRPYLIAAIAASIFYPIAALVLRGIGRPGETESNVMLERGA